MTPERIDDPRDQAAHALQPFMASNPAGASRLPGFLAEIHSLLVLNSLAHKVALVTGVTRRQGIGAAVALSLAQAGADVFTAYYRPYDRSMPWGVEDTEPTQILDALRETGVEIDLAHPEGPRALFAQAQVRFGRIDILVNNAAYSTVTRVEQMTA